MEDTDVFIILCPKFFAELVLLEAHGDLNSTLCRFYLNQLTVFPVGCHKANIIEKEAARIIRSRFTLINTCCNLLHCGIIFRSAIQRSNLQLCIVRYS